MYVYYYTSFALRVSLKYKIYRPRCDEDMERIGYVLPTESINLKGIAVSGGFAPHGTRAGYNLHFSVRSFPENDEFRFVVVRIVDNRHVHESWFVDGDVIIVFDENDVRDT